MSSLSVTSVNKALAYWAKGQKYPKELDGELTAYWLDLLRKAHVTDEELEEAAKILPSRQPDFPAPHDVLEIIRARRKHLSELPLPFSVHALEASNPVPEPTDEEIRFIREKAYKAMNINLEDPEHARRVQAQIQQLRRSRREA